MPDNTKRNYRINLATADKKSIIFGEKDGEFKVHYISKFNGICIADDGKKEYKNFSSKLCFRGRSCSELDSLYRRHQKSE